MLRKIPVGERPLLTFRIFTSGRRKKERKKQQSNHCTTEGKAGSSLSTGLRKERWGMIAETARKRLSPRENPADTGCDYRTEILSGNHWRSVTFHPASVIIAIVPEAPSSNPSVEVGTWRLRVVIPLAEGHTLSSMSFLTSEPCQIALCQKPTAITCCRALRAGLAKHRTGVGIEYGGKDRTWLRLLGLLTDTVNH